jgi:ribosomal protein S18 acetylase RimI-like enzyme
MPAGYGHIRYAALRSDVMPDRQFVLEDPTPADIQYLEDKLYEFNAAQTGIEDGRSLAFFLRDAAMEITAAAAGHTWGETCELQQLWVAESLRRQGIGRRLLEEAEAEAIRRGCSQLILATHSFQAPRFYQNLGFKIVGTIPEYPRGHSQILLRKGLRERAA